MLYNRTMKKANKYKVCQVSLSRKIIGRHSLLPVLQLHGKEYAITPAMANLTSLYN